MWLEPFAEVLAHLLASALVRVKAWREYRRNYSAAERREHRRQLESDRLSRQARGPSNYGA